MRVVHVLKRLETIDNDIKELRKLEKTLTRDKSFATPIFMTIEKQINIMLDERIKLLNLKIDNPPQNLLAEMELDADEKLPEPLQVAPEMKPAKKAKPQPQEQQPGKKPQAAKPKPAIVIPDDDDIPMLTQDQIDARFNSLKTEEKKEARPRHTEEKKHEPETASDDSTSTQDDTSIKLLDVALEKGTLNRKVLDREKKVRFFRENFPAD